MSLEDLSYTRFQIVYFNKFKIKSNRYGNISFIIKIVVTFFFKNDLEIVRKVENWLAVLSDDPGKDV